MLPYLLLFATIAFAGLAILFFVHYRKMVDLETQLNNNMIALSHSESWSKSLQLSLDTYSSKFEKILMCFNNDNQTTDEKISCISKLIGD